MVIIVPERKVPGNIKNESLKRKNGAGRDGTADSWLLSSLVMVDCDWDYTTGTFISDGVQTTGGYYVEYYQDSDRLTE